MNDVMKITQACRMQNLEERSVNRVIKLYEVMRTKGYSKAYIVDAVRRAIADNARPAPRSEENATESIVQP